MLWKRDAGANSASVSTSASNPEDIREQLAALEDEEKFNATHARHILLYNLTNPLFWMLMLASLCFATLNAHHGFVTSGGEAMLPVAITIGALYFIIELTIPASAHLMTWSAPGRGVRLLVRTIGIFAFTLGVSFSLTILQDNFTSGAEQAQTKSENNSSLLTEDRASFAALTKEVADLRIKAGGRSDSAIDDDMKTLLAQPIRKGGETVGESSDNCAGTRSNKVAREKCAEYDQLARQKGAARDLASKLSELNNVRARINGANEEGVSKTANKSDTVIAGVMGWKAETLKDVKPTVISIVAAFLTHLLWAAHGAGVNVSISRRLNSTMRRASLQRQLSLHERQTQMKAAQTTAEFMSKRGGVHERAAAAIASASLPEQPLQLQITEFLNTKVVLGHDYEQSIGMIHDEYSRWSAQNNLERCAIDRFAATLRTLGFTIGRDGRVLGMALK